MRAFPNLSPPKQFFMGRQPRVRNFCDQKLAGEPGLQHKTTKKEVLGQVSLADPFRKFPPLLQSYILRATANEVELSLAFAGGGHELPLCSPPWETAPNLTDPKWVHAPLRSHPLAARAQTVRGVPLS